MPSSGLGPVVMDTTGDAFVDSARIANIIWVGATTAGDTVRIDHRDGSNTLLWKAITNDERTYLGLASGERGIHAPYGFTLAQISAGEILVYLRED